MKTIKIIQKMGSRKKRWIEFENRERYRIDDVDEDVLTLLDKAVVKSTEIVGSYTKYIVNTYRVDEDIYHKLYEYFYEVYIGEKPSEVK